MHRQIKRLLTNKERELKTILNIDAPDSFQNNRLKATLHQKRVQDRLATAGVLTS